jgi:2,3-bisphosphoglycerate-dependent phosphoglycerate mutase
MQFVFVRHAQPEWFRDGAAIDDPGLTELGWAQARHLGRRFRHDTADLLLVSPLPRARETAEPIAEALGLEPVVLDWLAELQSPPWAGAPIDFVQATFEQHRDKPLEAIWEGLEGGESFHRFHDRVTSGLVDLLASHGVRSAHPQPALWQLDPSTAAPERRVVIVAHGGTNATAIAHLLGIPPVPWEWERFVAFHASVSDVHPIPVSGRHAYSLVRFADVSHLPPGIQTR